MTNTGDVERVDVVIVGGGLAGLTAAVGLRGSGLKTVVLERAHRLGGRAMSWEDSKTGDPIHIGPHIFLSEYPNMMALLDLLGTRDKLVWQRGRFIRMVDGRHEIDMKMHKLPPPLHYAPSLIADKTIGHRDVISNLPVSLLAAQLDERSILKLDNVNAAAFLRSMGVTEYFIQRFWAFAGMAIMNVPLELCSAGALLRFYRRLIGHQTYDVGFADGGLGDSFAPRARELIEQAGGRVELGAEVRRLLGDNQRATGVVLRDGRQILARHVIVALPPQALRRIAHRHWLRHKPYRDLVHFLPCPYVSSYLWFDRKLTDQKFWARVHDPNDLNCDFYDLSNINRGWSSRPSVIATNCIYSHRADGLEDEEIIAETVRELGEYLPEALDAKLEHWVVNRIPMAIHCPYPGTEQLRPATRGPVKNLLLAGDWLGTGLPASMESACASGWQAAEAVLEAEGKPESLVQEHKQVEGFVRAAQWLTQRFKLPHVPAWVRPTGRVVAPPPPAKARSSVDA